MDQLLDKLQNSFRQVQLNKRNHPQYMNKLKILYQKTDEKDFAKAFISCLVIPLSYGERNPYIENALSFAAKFAVSVYSFSNETNDEELCPFLSDLFDFLLSNHNTEDAALRFRICFFLNLLLRSMDDNAFIDDALCDRITTSMTERLMDKVPKVRAQAIFALHRLQDPTDEFCPIIKAFIFHLSKDPQAEVRQAVLLTIGKNKQTLAAVLRRTRDINDGVRKLAYQFLSKITVRSLTIEQREQLLKDGFHDRSETVSKYVKTQLLPVWFEHYNGEFIKLLQGLDAENALDISNLVLQVLFKSTPMRTIVEQLPIDDDAKLIPFEKLSSESVIYWRSVVEHFHREGFHSEMDKILPDLSKFCRYIRNFIEQMKIGERVDWEKVTQRFILIELFKIAKFYDLSDEVGRDNLKELILDTLKTESNSEVLIDCVIKQLVLIVPDIETRLHLLADVISERRMPLTNDSVPISEAEKHEREMKEARLRAALLQADEELDQAIKKEDFLKANEMKKKIHMLNETINELRKTLLIEEEVQEECELKNDEETLTQCLRIMFAMMQSVGSLYPLLRSHFEDIVVPSLDHPAPRIVILALKATTVCGLMDENLAKKYLPIFFLQFSMGDEDVWLASLKGIFDLLLRYGLDRLDMAPSSEAANNDQTNEIRRSRGVRLLRQSNDYDTPLDLVPAVIQNDKKNIITILTELLDNPSQSLRTIAVEGLCKLLLHRRISSAPLLARLIILWHNPVTDNDAYLRQCLSSFFSKFGMVVPDSQEMLERSFLMTLKILANAPDTSPLQEIDPLKVSQLILHLTSPEDRNQPLAYCPHNNLALAIIAEALNADSSIDPKVLIRSLRFLDLDLENDSVRECLQEAVERLSTQVEMTDKRIINAILTFKSRLAKGNEDAVDGEMVTEGNSCL